MSVTQDQLEQISFRSPIDDADLDEALAAVRDRLQVIEARMEQLEQAAVAARKEETLLEGLVALRRGDSPGSAARPLDDVGGASDAGSQVVEATIALLSEQHRPMHISELMAELARREVRIPGSGQQANLISHLRRDKRIVRPSRGIYGLAEWGLKDAPTPTRKRKRARRRKPVKTARKS